MTTPASLRNNLALLAETPNNAKALKFAKVRLAALPPEAEDQFIATTGTFKAQPATFLFLRGHNAATEEDYLILETLYQHTLNESEKESPLFEGQTHEPRYQAAFFNISNPKEPIITQFEQLNHFTLEKITEKTLEKSNPKKAYTIWDIAKISLDEIRHIGRQELGLPTADLPLLSVPQ